MVSDAQNRRLVVAAAAAASVLAVAAVGAVTMIAIEDAASPGGADGGAAAAQSGAPTSDAQPGGKEDGGAGGTPVSVLEPGFRGTDIIMPTKVSRPGCEETDSCYLPPAYAAAVGQPVVWTNEDSAFHTVTSGTYDAPLDTFDSGYMEPYDSYVLSFDAPGTYPYYCTLHPWMQGVVTVVAPGG